MQYISPIPLKDMKKMKFETAIKTAERLGVNIRTVQKWAKLGKLEGADGIKVEKTDKDGKAQFVLSFDSADIGETYTFTLSEVKGDLKDMEYSEKEYEISIRVYLDVDNKVVAEVLVDGEDYTDKDIVAEFININKANIPVEPTPEPQPAPTPVPAPTTSPQTGYNRNTGLLLGALLISGGLAIYATVNLNKKEKEE